MEYWTLYVILGVCSVVGIDKFSSLQHQETAMINAVISVRISILVR